MNDDAGAATAESGDAISRDRSPPFPFIPLEKAIERARQFESQYKKSAGRLSNVFPLWNYTAKSSGAQQTVGALKAFGLIEDEGSGADRKIKLSDLALRILKDERPGKREEAIKEAALKPKAILEHWARWRDGRPPDRECYSELTLERGFTEDAAKRFVQVYDDTIRFSKIETSEQAADKVLREIEELPPSIKVGDFIQWAPGGIVQFPEPRRVRGIADGGDFVLVDGSDTGLPIREVTVVQPSHTIEPKAAGMALTGNEVKVAVPNVRQDVWNLDEGPVVLQYPAKMSGPSFEDFEAWINLQLKKIKRGIEQ